MAKVKTPTGEILDVTSRVALRYYQREPDYEVLDENAPAEEQPATGKARRAPAKTSEPPTVDSIEPVDS